MARHIVVRLVPWSDFVQSVWRLDGHAYTEECIVRVVRDIDLFIKEEKSFGLNGPTWGWEVELGGWNWI